MPTLPQLHQRAGALRAKMERVAVYLEQARAELGFATKKTTRHRASRSILRGFIGESVKRFQHHARQLHATEAAIEDAEACIRPSALFIPTLSEEARRALREINSGTGPIHFGASGFRAASRIPA